MFILQFKYIKHAELTAWTLKRRTSCCYAREISFQFKCFCAGPFSFALAQLLLPMTEKLEEEVGTWHCFVIDARCRKTILDFTRWMWLMEWALVKTSRKQQRRKPLTDATCRMCPTGILWKFSVGMSVLIVLLFVYLFFSFCLFWQSWQQFLAITYYCAKIKKIYWNCKHVF